MRFQASHLSAGSSARKNKRSSSGWLANYSHPSGVGPDMRGGGLCRFPIESGAHIPGGGETVGLTTTSPEAWRRYNWTDAKQSAFKEKFYRNTRVSGAKDIWGCGVRGYKCPGEMESILKNANAWAAAYVQPESKWYSAYYGEQWRDNWCRELMKAMAISRAEGKRATSHAEARAHTARVAEEARAKRTAAAAKKKTEMKTVTHNVGFLKQGSRNTAQIALLHQALDDAWNKMKISGYDVRSALASERAAGQFGGQTKRAVEAFQSQNDLGVDGQVGNCTWAALVKTSLHGNFKTAGVCRTGTAAGQSRKHIASKSAAEPTVYQSEVTQKVPFYKKKWFIPVVAGVVVIGVGSIFIFRKRA